MKFLKLITIIVALTTITNVNAQKAFTEYNSTYFESVNEILIDVKNEYKYDLYIYMNSLDTYYKKGGVITNEKNNDKFITSLNLAKTKYTEWKNIALTNNVYDLNKKMDHSCFVSGYFQYGGKWNIDSSIKIEYAFKMIENNPVLIVHTGKMISSSNQYIDHKGFVFVFQNESEIDNFINVISQETINDFIAKPKSEDLFK